MSSFALHSAPRNAPFGIGSARLIAGLICGLSSMFGMTAAKADTVIGGTGQLPHQSLRVGGEGSAAQQPDLLVNGTMTVTPGTYMYGNVNIVNGGQLIFAEGTDSNPEKNNIEFWASSIIIENGGAMTAGVPTPTAPKTTPFGTSGGTLTIHLYGKDQSNGDPVINPGQGVLCRSSMPGTAPCGIPQAVWDNNGASPIPGCVGLDPPSTTCLPGLPAATKDYFYQYGPLYGDGMVVASGPDQGKVGYFGYKTLAVSFGGTLALYGSKGAVGSDYKCPDALSHRRRTGDLRRRSAKTVDNDPLCSGVSWMRLNDGATLAAGKKSLTLERDPENWQKGDQIVVTTTDYLPSHSEQLTVDNPRNGAEVNFHTPTGPTQWLHNGIRYGGASDTPERKLETRLPPRITIDDVTKNNGAETRASVALLTRSIRIVSEGDAANESFDAASTRTTCPVKTVWNSAGTGCYYFGAHSVVRQGFAKFQVQGVEFNRMGQGGRLAHYPVHFHMARQTPQGEGGTYVKDSSINESMTRWYVIHSTQGVTLARNVGYKSIGHGYYLEDATETDNNFYSNIGILARAAVLDKQNDRQVPGILADNTDPNTFTGKNVANQGFPYRSDNEFPTVFWITNGWNEFIGNMAAGAETCGAAYWFVPAANSDMSDVGMMPMKWSGYAALQKNTAYAGTTPLKVFYKNYATSTMHSFQTTSDAPACGDLGVIAANASTLPGRPISDPPLPTLKAVASIAPAPLRMTVTNPEPPPDTYTVPDNEKDPYYPHVIGGARKATQCPLVAGQYDCSNVTPCATGVAACAVTVLDHYTTAFHWASGTISAIWLRPQWYLLDNSVISDVQNGGVTFVTGGDYTHASIIGGYWALPRNTLFIGNTQTGNAFASNAGPFNTASGLKCEPLVSGAVPGYCLNSEQGITLPVLSYMVNQKLSNIYDGPSYEDTNAYLDITKTPCGILGYNSDCIYGSGLPLGVRREPSSTSNTDQTAASCYLPNAAIAWKQPNAFFYPPAFHTTNLFFDNVDIRHYVINPLFKVPDGVGATDPKQDFGQGGTYLTDFDAAKNAFCNANDGMFNGYSGIDRQTELNDDDGSLTGLSNSLLQPIPPIPPNPLKQTISVNEDTYFTAPIETAECLADAGVVPANACTATPLPHTPVPRSPVATAKTSPYDYISTVVYHLSAKQETDPWSVDCANDSCYGVPLYRQDLTGTKGTNEVTSTREWAHWFHNGCEQNPPLPAVPSTWQCRWPFIRMAGEAISQRETLTANNGTYYIETNISLTQQQTEAYTNAGKVHYNVFKGGETYHVFFLYAKQTTKQTYQIYVGDGFNPNTDVDTERVNIDSGIAPKPDSGKGWLTVIKPVVNGVLNVTVDFAGFTDLDPSPDQGLCQPRTFCKVDGNSCLGNLDDPTNPLVVANPGMTAEATVVCGQWAMKDLDCPKIGCYGFYFKLPGGFPTDGTETPQGIPTHRPKPQPFPTTADTAHQPDWTTKFTKTSTAPDNAAGGQCFYEKLPGTDCPVP